jgi:excisionase family DNA binding protein
MVVGGPPMGGVTWYEQSPRSRRSVVGTGPFDDRGQCTDPRQLLTVADAAEYLAMSRGAVYNLLRCGELRSIHFGRSRRIVLGDLWLFVDQRTVGV